MTGISKTWGQKNNFDPQAQPQGQLQGQSLGLIALPYEQTQLDQRTDTFATRFASAKPIALLILCGTMWGLMPSLSKLASEAHSSPFGLALLVNALGALVLLGYGLARGSMRWPTRAETRFYLIWAVLYSLLNQVLIYWLSSKAPASYVSIVTVLEGFAVFIGAAMFGLERATLRRSIGLLIGLVGVSSLLLPQLGREGGGWLMLMISLAVPLTYAIETVFIAARRPADVSPLTCVTFVMMASVLMLLPLDFIFGGMSSLSPNVVTYAPYVMLIAAATITANVSFFALIKSGGAVCAGQSCYMITLAGIGWSALLNSEAITLNLLGALVLVLIGLKIVGHMSPCEDKARVEIVKAKAGVNQQP
jgi:drug/metabolite transporter (DMT)-like permease